MRESEPQRLTLGVMDSTTTLAVSGPLLVAALVAALAGAVSFASPCVVPLVPGYLAYLAGLVGADAPPVTPAEAQRPRTGRLRVAGAAALFVAGFTAVFGLGWVPCIGPTLAGVVAVAAGTGGGSLRGVVLVLAYCAGLGLPFVLIALGAARAVRAMGWLRRHTRGIQISGGVLLVAVGLLLVSGVWAGLLATLQTSVANFTPVL